MKAVSMAVSLQWKMKISKRIENCVPIEFMNMDVFDFQVFLAIRRTMMAKCIREYYEGLE